MCVRIKTKLLCVRIKSIKLVVNSRIKNVLVKKNENKRYIIQFASLEMAL